MLYYYIFAEEAHERCPNDQVREENNDHEYDKYSHLSIDKIFEVCLGCGF
jgi:hypothetical protein